MTKIKMINHHLMQLSQPRGEGLAVVAAEVLLLHGLDQEVPVGGESV